MPALRNSKHEAFAKALASNMNVSQAYVAAGYAESRSSASRLATNANILRRVEQIKARVADKAEWTAADRLLGLKTIYDATEGKDPRTAIAAISEANKMAGSYAPTKRELSGPGGGPIPIVDLTKATDEQLATLEAFFGPLALAGGDDEGDPAGEAEAGD